MERRITAFAVIFLSVFISACATTAVRTARDVKIEFSSPAKKILLVTPDVQLTEITTGGLPEARADWTEAALGFITKDISTHFEKSGADLVRADNLDNPHDAQLAKLHGVVGQAILTHAYNGVLKLPNKGDALDWSLGPGTNEMRQRYGADYALFVFVRDSYVSAGRAAVIGVAAVFGVGIPGGRQLGFASLVDLRTGNIVWFNRLASGTGDLRTAAPAQSTVDNLIKGMPL
jgi:hypothetical protein